MSRDKITVANAALHHVQGKSAALRAVTRRHADFLPQGGVQGHLASLETCGRRLALLVGLAGDQLATAGERLSVTDVLARYASSSSSPVARR